MKWHYLLVSVCLAVLVGLRLMDGKTGVALVLGAIGVAYLCGFYKSAVAGRNPRSASTKPETGKSGEEPPVNKFKPGRNELEAYLALQKRNSKNWLILAFVAGVCALVGIILLHFPPVSITMILIGIYCTVRYRSAQRMVKKAALALETLKD
ncbi:MAG: hypothetical protein ACOY3J_02150 [Bacillota bacterium]|uniref:Uncharacterized protein n=1 Tax=Thermanaerosceptrum fracticalcis TaxID=1712410 RepID=A0A7G6E4D5_THEFR|nr:hypothetical protein [Thermanaerosceptrum fracticalcis]QNB46939.1 hypothetical protein BR63_11830 [Thermanaerosceptrum fracticalcis]